MKCEDVKQLLSDYVSRDMEPALAVSVENHIAGCAECADDVAELKSVWASLDALEIVDPPKYFHENLMSRIDTLEDAEAAKRARWDWRALFKPRTLAYAASLVAIMLAGMGGLHYSKAGLDPIGSLLHLMHRTPPQTLQLSSSRAEWTPNAQGAGMLTVYLKAQPQTDGSTSTLNCVVNLPAGLAVSGTSTSIAVSSANEASIDIPLTEAPDKSSVSVTMSAAGSAGSAKTEPIPLMQPVVQPSR